MIPAFEFAVATLHAEEPLNGTLLLQLFHVADPVGLTRWVSPSTDMFVDNVRVAKAKVDTGNVLVKIITS